MKKINVLTEKTTTCTRSIITAALCLLLSMNGIAQAPPPTDPYVANVTSFGATGNDGTDDTQAIQNAIDWLVANHPGGTVLVPDGTYWADAVNAGIVLKSNMTLRMTSGAVITVITNNQDDYELIRVYNVSNVNVIGGTLQGDRYRNTSAGYSNCGMGINIVGSTNVYIQGVTSIDMWGDGFYVGGGQCTNVTLDGVIADNNRRQGLSITWADGVVVKNSVFENTNGADPQFGIDLEPNPNNIVNNINISTSQFSGNHNNGGIQLWPNLPYNCILTNVVINGVAQPDNVQSSITDANATRTVGSCGTPSPTLTVNPTSRAFGNVTVNTASTEQTYLLTGVNLGTNNITVTAPTGYTVSKTTGTGSSSSVSVTPSSGIVSQFIYVRFTPTAGQAYNGNITNTSTGAITQNVALTGSGTIPTALGTIDNTKVNTNQLIVYPNSSNSLFPVQSTREGVYSIINSLGQTM